MMTARSVLECGDLSRLCPLALSPGGQRVAVSVDAQRLQVWDLVELRLRLGELGLDWETSR